MGDVAVQNPVTGELRMVAEADAPAFVEQTGWVLPDQAERERGARILESGGAGQQALAGVETAVRTGTLGLVPGLAGGWQQRAEVQAEEHPYVRMAATGVGALAPALATGGLAGAAAGAAGLGAGATTALTAGVEGLAGGYAQELEDARSEMRDVSAGNVLLYGLGGEVMGRALPAALRMGAGRVRSALTAAEEIAGEGVPSAIAAVEARSAETEARLARSLPDGPERAAALERTAPKQYAELARDSAETAEQFASSAEALTTESPRLAERLRQTLPAESPAQQNFFTAQKAGLSQTVQETAALPELGQYGKDLRNAIRPGLRKMDAAESIADQYLAAREMAGTLDEIASRIDKDPELLERLRAPKPPPPPTELEQAALDYAQDAARRRLRGVAEHTGNEELAALAGPDVERSARAKALPDNVKLAINQKTGKASLDDIQAWVRDPEALRAGHGLSELSGVSVEPHGGAEAVIDRIRERAQALRQGLNDESLFGGAARLESDLARGQRRLAAGLEEARALSSPKKMRQFLETNRTDRAPLSGKLDDALEGAEDVLRVHETHGTLDPKQIAEARAQIGKLRQARNFADEIQIAKETRAAPAPPARAPKSGLDWRGAAEFALDEAAEMLPYPARRLYKFAKRVKGIHDAARMATRQTARKLAGVGAAEGAGLGQSLRKAAREAADQELGAAANRIVPGGSKAYQRAKKLLEQSRARTSQEGAVVIPGRRMRSADDEISQSLWNRRVSDIAQSLSDEDYETLKAFTQFGYNEQANREVRRAIDQVFRKVREDSLEVPGLVYRGINVPDPAKLFRVGEDFSESVYRSSSIDADVAEKFAVDGPGQAVVLEIEQSGGVPVMKSATSDEYEVILPRDAEYQVLRVEESDGITRVRMREAGLEDTEAGHVVIRNEPHPKIDKLATKLKDKLDKLDQLEDRAVPGKEDEFGLNPRAERHAERLDRAREDVTEGLHALRDEYASRIAETLDGRTQDELGPKARARYERLKAGQDELETVLGQHGGVTEQVDLGGGKTVEGYRIDRPREAARAYLSGRKTVNTEAGYARTGVTGKDILTSPIGLTAAAGTAALAAPKVLSALDRFTGDYSGPDESFAAKRKLLDQDLVAPDALYEALGASLEDLPKVSPELFQQLSARVAENVRYLRANLPPGIQTTMMYPNGTPPSLSAMREFATIYNTVTDPHSVLEDIETGTATNLQMRTLREAHPDLYEQLRGDVVEEIGQNFRNVPLSTKLQLDILFEADGLAGPFFSSKAADMISRGLKEDQKRGPSAQQMGESGEPVESAHGPAGMNAIQSSVTNKAA